MLLKKKTTRDYDGAIIERAESMNIDRDTFALEKRSNDSMKTDSDMEGEDTEEIIEYYTEDEEEDEEEEEPIDESLPEEEKLWIR